MESNVFFQTKILEYLNNSSRPSAKQIREDLEQQGISENKILDSFEKLVNSILSFKSSGDYNHKAGLRFKIYTTANELNIPEDFITSIVLESKVSESFSPDMKEEKNSNTENNIYEEEEEDTDNGDEYDFNNNDTKNRRYISFLEKVSLKKILISMMLIAVFSILTLIVKNKIEKRNTEGDLVVIKDSMKIVVNENLDISKDTVKIAQTQIENIEKHLIKDKNSINNITNTDIKKSVKNSLSNTSGIQKNSLKEISFEGHIFIGDIEDNLPNGIGKLVYRNSTEIFISENESLKAERGDYLKGRWKKGKLENGVLYDMNGNKKRSIILGRF